MHIWQKSSYSGTGANCIHLADGRDTVCLVESDEPNAVIATTLTGLRFFLVAVKTGRFDRGAR